MSFDRALRVAWLLFAITVFVVWCAFPRVRTVRVDASTDQLNVSLDGSVGLTHDGEMKVTHDGDLAVAHE